MYSTSEWTQVSRSVDVFKENSYDVLLKIIYEYLNIWIGLSHTLEAYWIIKEKPTFGNFE